jgi:hypothetical protein
MAVLPVVIDKLLSADKAMLFAKRFFDFLCGADFKSLIATQQSMAIKSADGSLS